MKAGASNHDKNRIRALHYEGKSVAQISALTSVSPKHVTAIVDRLKKTGKLIYAGGKKTSGGQLDYAPGAPESGAEDISEQEAVGRIQAESEQKIAELERQLAEATGNAEDASDDAEPDTPSTPEATDPAEAPEAPDVATEPVKPRRRRKKPEAA